MGLREKLIQISRPGRKRLEIGPEAEKLFREACQQLNADGKILGFEKKDRPGSDFSIHFLDEKTLKIEIKSSFSGKFSHQLKYSTPVLVVPLKKKFPSARKKRKLIGQIKRNIFEMRKNKFG